MSTHRPSVRQRVNERGESGERGSAVIAAIAVALIVLALGTVVVTQSIVVSRDSGRDRARTVQVHGAEGLVDAVYAQLESSTPCAWPTTGVEVVNTAPGSTDVVASIAYWDADGNPLTCLNGALSGLPARALVTATAEATEGTGFGIQPRRTVQSEVLMTPHVTPGFGAAVFSANGGEVTNTAITNPTSPETPADVWIDSGNVSVNSAGRVNGRLLVPQGRVDFSNTAQVVGDLWALNGFTVHQNPGNGAYSVTGNVTVARAGVTLANGVMIGGDLTAAGALTTWGTPAPRIDGARNLNVADIPLLEPVGLPEVLYRPADWSGFTVESYLEWIKWNADGAGGTHTPAATWSNFRRTPLSTSNQCGQLSAMNYGLGGPLTSRSTPRIYDAWACGTIQMREMDIVLYSDVVIFAKGFTLSNAMNIRSGDGGDHRLWLIVPDQNANGVAQCAGGATEINISNSLTTHANTAVFFYTPCRVNMSNNLVLRGQVYGSNVILRNGVVINYVPMGIPGVIGLSGTSTTADSFTIDVVYKRETTG